MKFKKIIKSSVISFLNKMPYVRGLYKQSLNCCFPNGHFYSPVVSIEDIKERADSIWQAVETPLINGIDLRTEAQKQLVKKFEAYYKELPFKPEKSAGLRYQFENGSYSYTDAIILYSFIRHFKPKRVIEIGSGYSSMVMLDTNELFFSNEIDLTFIEPYPNRLYALLKEGDLLTNKILTKKIQDVPLSVFDVLESGDILFIDSTHVSKTGSDVNFIMFHILPRLKAGVLIHFHDIFYPFEYPKEWVFQGRNWNEAYIIKAFLMYNAQFEIKLFSEYLHKFHGAIFESMPLCYSNLGGNLWLEKK
ncbi:class I SAM-dependent methyltransferase [Thalassobellus suaedae]|uniref:Class I SAM-dependent methyltransferase n=1 Tax=Thalassobellus suaedae TaxID=3074124 RepID=A0ABY9Y0B1_9FLAO|nr:class I SAM-dependent methyltransferase [Flavobacteriaceae bacterium HL-DH10]